MRRLRRSHDHPLFVDPDPARNVDHAEKSIEGVGLIDQRRMVGRRLCDPWTCCLDAARIESDGDDLETLRPQLGPQLLPHGQVKTAASPRCPRDEKHLRPAE
jgi:hypothetical protein